MTRTEWNNKFMPQDASEFAELDSNDPHVCLAAAKHSLRKWIGLRIKVDGREVPSMSNCALCKLCFSQETLCAACPLAAVRRGAACDDFNEDCDEQDRNGEGWSPYGAYTCNGDPEPMIRELTRCVRVCVRALHPEHDKLLEEII